MKIERRGDDICLGFLLQRELFERGWDQRFEGEISGVIGAGAFVRFEGRMADGYEGFIPMRKLHGDHYDLNETDSALIGARSGRRLGFGDPLEIRVESVEPARGRVDLLLADGDQRRNGGGGKRTKRGSGGGKGKASKGGKGKTSNNGKGRSGNGQRRGEQAKGGKRKAKSTKPKGNAGKGKAGKGQGTGREQGRNRSGGGSGSPKNRSPKSSGRRRRKR
jgi:hypothetical protein